MRMLPRDYATAFYLATRCMSDKDATKATDRFVALMTDRGLAEMLPATLAALPAAAAACDGIATVTIETAHEADEGTIRRALAALGIDEKAAEIATAVRPELIGGIRVAVEDRVYDASVKGRLHALKAAVTAGTNA